MQEIPAAARLLSRQVRCGKRTCRRCADGIGHGPYWYASWREGGKVRQRYLGKTAPTGTPTMSGLEQLHDAPLVPAPSAQEMRTNPPAAPQARATPPTPVRLRIRLLGSVEVERDGVQAPQPSWRRSAVKSLLGMLLIADRQQLTREVIADRLFPDASGAVANSRLGDLLHLLRVVLEPDRGSRQPSRYILQDGPLVRFCLSQDTWVDYLAFNQALAACDQADPTLAHLRHAIACYGGDLLPAEQGDWCISAREGIRIHWHGLLRRYGLAQSRQGQVTGALTTFQRLFGDNPGDEIALPMIVRLLLSEQRRSDALHYFHHAQRVLLREEDPHNPALLRAATMLRMHVERGPG
jgi:DNA-binding SARP family transcriptional activator